MSQSDKLSALGIDPAMLSADQRAVLKGLTEDEFNTLASVRRQLDGAEGDVQGHSNDVGGLLF